MISNAKAYGPGTVKGRLINSLRVKQPLMVGQNAEAMDKRRTVEWPGIARNPPPLRIGGCGWSVMVPESPTPTPSPTLPPTLPPPPPSPHLLAILIF
jgi:hypothetical protein